LGSQRLFFCFGLLDHWTSPGGSQKGSQKVDSTGRAPLLFAVARRLFRNGGGADWSRASQGLRQEQIAQPKQGQGRASYLGDYAMRMNDVCDRIRSDFLERHLPNRVPVAEAKLRRTEAPGFPVLMAMLVRFARREHDAVGGGT
jgi:hypothetical protein